MQIINTDIIKDTQDVFWDKPLALRELPESKVLVITGKYQHGGKEEEQLLGILRSGCRLSGDQYNIIQLMDNEQIAWHYLKEQLKPRVVLLFGVMPSALGVAALFRLNDINNFDNCFWVPSVTLGQLIEDVTYKSQLWGNALKPLFADKQYGDILSNKIV